MNKEQLVAAIAAKTGASKAVARATLDATLEAIRESLAKGEPVQLVGFGSFTIAERRERRGRNPRTGEPILIPSKKVVRFRPGKKLQEAVSR